MDAKELEIFENGWKDIEQYIFDRSVAEKEDVIVLINDILSGKQEEIDYKTGYTAIYKTGYTAMKNCFDELLETNKDLKDRHRRVIGILLNGETK